jgi:hypothetical protein
LKGALESGPERFTRPDTYVDHEGETKVGHEYEVLSAGYQYWLMKQELPNGGD